MILSIILANLVAIPSAQTAPVIPKAEVTYTIPALEGMEAPLTFGIENASFGKRRGVALMRFSLPALLTGTETKVFKLKGPIDGNSITMLGEGANAVCSTDVTATECQIKFDPLTIDYAASDLLLDSNLSGPIAAAIKAGREAFEHQAVGVIRFEH
jgi:hypothetical protein